ncbi:hypothetical protein KF840_17950 [bacterium]|nr:hypothetical protein [bacterium]
MLRGLAIAILSTAYLLAVAGEIPVYEETNLAMLLARDGLASGRFEGNATTFAGLRTGTLMIRCFAAVLASGLGMVALQMIVAMAWGVSMAVFDRGVRRWFGADVGWTPVGILLPLLVVAAAFPLADTGYLGAPVLVASTLTLLQVAAGGSSLAAAACGASLALAAEMHPVLLLGVPVFLVTTWMSCPRPFRALSAGVASGVAMALAASFHTWIDNARALLMTPWTVPLIAGAAGCGLAIATWGRRRWLALAVERRLVLLLVGTVAFNAAAIIAASAAARSLLLRPHYVLFSLPALAILAALALRRWRARGGVGRFAAPALPLALLAIELGVGIGWRLGVATGTPAAPTYRMREAETLARHFWSAGYVFPDVQRHLRGPQGLELMGAISAFAPSADAAPERPMPDLRVLAFSQSNRPDGPLPAGGTELDLGRGRRAWILPLDGWVRLAPSRVCLEPLAATGVPDCIDIDSDAIAYTGRYRDLYQRIFPAFQAALARQEPAVARDRRFAWELPIEITGSDRERHVDIVGLIGVAPWRIVRVDGVDYRGALPARHVVLERGGARSGRLVLAADPSPMALKNYPPDFIETRPDEGALRASLRRLPPLGRRICESVGTCPEPVAD